MMMESEQMVVGDDACGDDVGSDDSGEDLEIPISSVESGTNLIPKMKIVDVMALSFAKDSVSLDT
jgi:hypothetical protein